MTGTPRKSDVLFIPLSEDDLPRWWFARNLQTGREGVVPAAYLY
jgi:hypothetical protein